MIKGVNKQIIEVNNPDSIYFEKAVFYLRPGVRKLPAEIAVREIDRCIGGRAAPLSRRQKLLRLSVNLTYIAVMAVIICLFLTISR